MPANSRQKNKNAKVLIKGNVEHSNIVVGDNNRLEFHYHGKQIIIPSVEDIERHRVALKEKLEKEALAHWGGMSFYIQEEGVTLPIEASPYETGQLGARVNLQDSLKSAERMLLLGDPGSGKTVALERLAWELSAGAEPVIPLLIKLFKYDGKPIADWVRARLQECGCLRLDDEDMLTVFLQESATRCVFLFDGLNEIAPEHRNILVGELERWISAHPRHEVVITSRVQDELWRTLRGEIPVMVVQPIHNKQALGYLIAHLGKTKGTDLYRRLDLDDRLLGLTRNPLLLWMIKEAGAVGESLPDNRGELYQRFVRRMLRRDTERQMHLQFSESMKERALSTLALHNSRMQRLTCPRREAVDVVADVFGKDVPEKLDKAEALVDACARHGLLAGEDELWFAPHQTVQEHFSAVALQGTVRQEQSLSGATRFRRNFQEILTHKKNGLASLAAEDWWMETLVQLAGIIEDPNWLVRTIVQTNPWLAWWCVQEGKQVDETTRLWIEERSNKLLKSPRVSDRRRAIQTLLRVRNERVLRPLLQTAGDEDQENSRLAVQGLADMGEAARALVEEVLHGKDELPWPLFVSVLRYLRVFPDDSLWAEFAEQILNKVSLSGKNPSIEDRRLAIKAMAHKKSERFVVPLLKATVYNDEEISRYVALGLADISEAAKTKFVDLLLGKDESLWELTLRSLSASPRSPVWLEVAKWIRADNRLLSETSQRLQKQADSISFQKGDLKSLSQKMTPLNTLAYVESGVFTSQFWKPPYGEPEWVTISAGEFWMGDNNSKYDDEKPEHKLHLPEYKIARVPVTNAQYAFYVQSTKVKSPEHWRGHNIPSGLENHPVVNVSWHDALAYCKWLGEKIQKPVTLPSEAEWEKAARGDRNIRKYPWGDDWYEFYCNSAELGLRDITAVGLFLSGTSPYGLLDMSGNIWEWTRSLYKAYPYKSDDGREELQSTSIRVIRGGSNGDLADRVRCAYRSWHRPEVRFCDYGFRVVISSVFPQQEHQ